VRDPFAPAERRHGRKDVGRQGPTEEELGKLLAISGVPDLLEISWMQRVYERMRGFAQEQRIVDGVRFVEKWKEQQSGQEDSRHGQAQGHPRGLAR